MFIFSDINDCIFHFCVHMYVVYILYYVCVWMWMWIYMHMCVYANVEATDRLGVFLDHFQSFLTQERSLTLELTDWLASWRFTCVPTPSARVTDMCYLPGLAFMCVLGLPAQLLMFA